MQTSLPFASVPHHASLAPPPPKLLYLTAVPATNRLSPSSISARMLSAAGFRRWPTTAVRIPSAPFRLHISPRPHHRAPLVRAYSRRTRPDDNPHSFFANLGKSLRNTKIEWYHIPVGLGIAVVGFTQIRKRHNATSSDDPSSYGPLPERAVRPMGAWYESPVPFTS
jgi:hypothetical protein